MALRSKLSWVQRIGLGPRRYWPVLIATALAEAAHAPFVGNAQATPHQPPAADKKSADKPAHPDAKKSPTDMHGPRQPDKSDDADSLKREKKRKPDRVDPLEPDVPLFDPTPDPLTPSTYTPQPNPTIRLFEPGGGGGGDLPVIDGGGGGDDPLVPRDPPSPRETVHGSDNGGGSGNGGNSNVPVPEPESMSVVVLTSVLLSRRANAAKKSAPIAP